MTDFTLYNMDVLKALQQIKPESVDCCITSPPYWGLRDYGVEGQIGLEEHPQQYIAKMVEVFAEVKKVLKPTGSLWLNIGDTYFGSGAGTQKEPDLSKSKEVYVLPYTAKKATQRTKKSNWLQPKQKMLIPHRLAIAMQENGWILRNDIIWHKPNHMPSSVKDRLTTSFEYVFHFVKQRKYYYDLDAIREPHICYGVTEKRPMDISRQKLYEGSAYNKSTDPKLAQFKYNNKDAEKFNSPRARASRGNFDENSFYNFAGKNPGDFWIINSKPYPEAHFACYPPTLVEKPLKATCPKQICTKCGWIRERITKPTDSYKKIIDEEKKGVAWNKERRYSALKLGNALGEKASSTTASYKTIGWTSCSCNAGFQPGTVLDPFVGSGTTLLVAQELGLKGIGIELNAEYIPLIKKRLLGDANQTSLNPNKIEVKT